MGKLVGLLSSGIGLAFEAAAEYQSSNEDIRKRKNVDCQQDISPGMKVSTSSNHLY